MLVQPSRYWLLVSTMQGTDLIPLRVSFDLDLLWSNDREKERELLAELVAKTCAAHGFCSPLKLSQERFRGTAPIKYSVRRVPKECTEYRLVCDDVCGFDKNNRPVPLMEKDRYI